MSNYNKVILVGHLTRDPELRYTPKGTAVAKLGLAINRVWTNEAGEKKEEVTFVDADVFGRTAENCGQYLRKGRPLLVEGRLKLDQWDDRETGQKRQRLGVIGEFVQFLGTAAGKGEAAPARGDARPTGRPADPDELPSSAAAAQAAPTPESDDVPF